MSMIVCVYGFTVRDTVLRHGVLDFNCSKEPRQTSTDSDES